MAAYISVGGAWLGGWCCRTVARRLHDEGHDVYSVTLTGLGERVHLAPSELDLDTHITDVVNLVEFENLNDVALLGHSYAGVRSQKFICSQRGGEFTEGAENEREVLRMRRWLVIFAAGLAMFISTMDMSVVNVDLPTPAHEFGEPSHG